MPLFRGYRDTQRAPVTACRLCAPVTHRPNACVLLVPRCALRGHWRGRRGRVIGTRPPVKVHLQRCSCHERPAWAGLGCPSKSCSLSIRRSALRRATRWAMGTSSPCMPHVVPNEYGRAPSSSTASSVAIAGSRCSRGLGLLGCLAPQPPTRRAHTRRAARVGMHWWIRRRVPPPSPELRASECSRYPQLPLCAVRALRHHRDAGRSARRGPERRSPVTGYLGVGWCVVTKPVKNQSTGSGGFTSSPGPRFGRLVQVFENVWWAWGTTRFAPGLLFPRNMVILREAGELVIVHPVMMPDAAQAEIEALGPVRHIVRLGAFHGMDDPLYVKRYAPIVWAPPGVDHREGVTTHRELRPGGELPLAGATLFAFGRSRTPETAIHLARHGGLLLTCDSIPTIACVTVTPLKLRRRVRESLPIEHFVMTAHPTHARVPCRGRGRSRWRRAPRSASSAWGGARGGHASTADPQVDGEARGRRTKPPGILGQECCASALSVNIASVRGTAARATSAHVTSWGGEARVSPESTPRGV